MEEGKYIISKPYLFIYYERIDRQRRTNVKKSRGPQHLFSSTKDTNVCLLFPFVRIHPRNNKLKKDNYRSKENSLQHAWSSNYGRGGRGGGGHHYHNGGGGGGSDTVQILVST